MIQDIQINNEEIRFTLKNSSISMANTLRRIMISEIPTLSIDKVYFEKNDSNMPDEVVAHRLGLIPLRFNPRILKQSADCDCELECPNCTVRYTCNLTCNENEYEVTSDDILLDPNWNQSSQIDQSPVKYNIRGHYFPVSILKLYRGESLLLKADAKIGIAREHAKWSPVSVATYNFSSQNDGIHFYVESNGSYHPLDILKTSLDVLYKKLCNIRSNPFVIQQI